MSDDEKNEIINSTHEVRSAINNIELMLIAAFILVILAVACFFWPIKAVFFLTVISGLWFMYTLIATVLMIRLAKRAALKKINK